MLKRLETRKPPALHPGDAIGIVSPCLPLLPSFREHYERGKQTLLEMGFYLKEGKTVHAPAHFYAADTPQNQAADINAMFADPEVKAIIATSGGHSASTVLPYLDYGLIRQHPKPFIGMSDMTAYHMAIYAKTGMVGFHMDELVFGLGWNWNRDEYKNQKKVKQTFKDVLTTAEPLGALPHITPWESWRDGSASGKLIGGTLPLLTYSVGTPYFPNAAAFDNAILFWEVTGRPLHEVQRMLCQLKYTGVLERISGMLIGTLTDILPLGRAEIVEPDAKTVVLELTQEYGFPIMASMDFGHNMLNLPMPIGIRASFDTKKLELRLDEGAVAYRARA
jgi:muramoyltetrapeptide carboxypeptidase